MKSAVLSGMMLALVLGACSSNNDVTGSETKTCNNLSGTFTATAFTATGTSNAALTNNFLSNGGAFTLAFNDGGFNSSFIPATGMAADTVSGTVTASGNTITLGSNPLFVGAPSGAQVFTCTVSGNTLTLTNTNTLFLFPGDSIARPAQFNLTLTHS